MTKSSESAGGLGLSRRQLGWFICCRLLAVSLLFVTALYFQHRSGSSDSLRTLRWLTGLVGLSYAQTLLTPLFFRTSGRYRLFIQAQIVWDLLFAILFVYFTGGVDSPFAFLFILITLSAGVFLQRRESLAVAAASSILYGSLLDLQFYGYLPALSLHADVTHASGHAVLYAVVTNVIAYFLTALLSGLLAERLRHSQQELKRREIDYEELDSLNRTIVASLSSGLMTINAQGRIRVFNPGAERITGLRLDEVYDRDVRDVFPNLNVYDGEFVLRARGEGVFVDSNGVLLTLGFATSLIQAGGAHEVLGLLISFQDLTRLKEVEGLLRRNDRLAAVGQLAAGLAHEIRNPLASISGSVQLLLENTHGSEEDRRLMRIVVKEAERLNRLLGDFLRFARPAPLQVEWVDVSELLDELISVAGADPRCAQIVFQRGYAPHVLVQCDRGQLQQAVWNLVVNAIDVLSATGTVFLGLDTEKQTLIVEDNGPGITVEVAEQMFTPFFTTKDSGTGLGLATVHAIMEAHGGNVTVGRGRAGGARFDLYLPGPWQVSSEQVRLIGQLEETTSI